MEEEVRIGSSLSHWPNAGSTATATTSERRAPAIPAPRSPSAMAFLTSRLSPSRGSGRREPNVTGNGPRRCSPCHYSNSDGVISGVVWEDGAVREVPELPGGVAAINASGDMTSYGRVLTVKGSGN